LPRIAQLLLLICLLFTPVAAQTAPSDYGTQLQEYDRRVAAQNREQNEAYAHYLEADAASRTRTLIFLGVTLLALAVYTLVNQRIARNRIQALMGVSREHHERSIKQGEQIIQLLASINAQLAQLHPTESPSPQDRPDQNPRP